MLTRYSFLSEAISLSLKIMTQTLRHVLFAVLRSGPMCGIAFLGSLFLLAGACLVVRVPLVALGVVFATMSSGLAEVAENVVVPGVPGGRKVTFSTKTVSNKDGNQLLIAKAFRKYVHQQTDVAGFTLKVDKVAVNLLKESAIAWSHCTATSRCAKDKCPYRVVCELSRQSETELGHIHGDVGQDDSDVFGFTFRIMTISSCFAATSGSEVEQKKRLMLNNAKASCWLMLRCLPLLHVYTSMCTHMHMYHCILLSTAPRYSKETSVVQYLGIPIAYVVLVLVLSNAMKGKQSLKHAQ